MEIKLAIVTNKFKNILKNQIIIIIIKTFFRNKST